jgi:tight adherence protein B
MGLQITLILIAIFALGAGWVVIWYRSAKASQIQKRIYKRLATISQGRGLPVRLTTDEILSVIPWLNAKLYRHPGFLQWQGLMRKVGWKIRIDQVLILNAILIILLPMLLLLLGFNGLLTALLTGILMSAPWVLLAKKLATRQNQLEQQLPDVLDFISRAMQAGHTFLGALQLVSSESQEPIRSEFQRAFQEISLGKTIQDAMADLSKRINCSEMGYFAVAVFINQEVGGNLANLITGVSSLIRDRLKSKLKLNALTAEARASAWVLSLLPVVMALTMTWLRPEFISVFWKDPVGQSLVGYTLLVYLLGILWMQRLSKIRI